MPHCYQYRSKHAVLIQNCYPGKEGGTTPRSSELSYLTFYASSRPAKLTKVGAYIQRKVMKDIRKDRKENNLVSLHILKALIQSCHGDMNIFSRYLMNIFCKLFDTRDIELIDQTCETFIVFCTYHDGSTLGLDTDFTHNYELLLEKFSSFCNYKNRNQLLELKMKYIGQRGIQAAITSQALLSSNYIHQLNILLYPLMNILTQTDHLLSLNQDGGTIDIRESVLNKDDIDYQYIQSVAIHTLSILFSKLTGHHIRISLLPLFDYLDEKNKWSPSSLSVSIMKIVVESMQSQYKHLFVSEILQQFDPKDVESNKQFSLVSVLDIILNNDTPLLGVSVLEVLNSLFCLLVQSAQHDNQPCLDIQQRLIHTVGGLGSHIYYDNQLSDMTSYLVNKLKPYTTTESIDHLPIYTYRSLALSCLDTISLLSIEVLSQGLSLLEDKNPRTRLAFAKIVYPHLQKPLPSILTPLLRSIYRWALLPNLNLTDLRTIYAFLCRLNVMFDIQALAPAISLVFKVMQEIDLSRQYIVESMIVSWLKTTAHHYCIQDLQEYTDELEPYPLNWIQEIPESIEDLPKANTNQSLEIDRDRVAEALSSGSRPSKADLLVEWDTQDLGSSPFEAYRKANMPIVGKHNMRPIQTNKPKLTSPWEHMLNRPQSEKRDSINVATLKEVLITQTSDESDSTTQASSHPSEHKSSLNALLTELKSPPSNLALSLVNPPYKI